MKKILIILVFLLLVGCTNDYPDFNDDVTITLNITSEVDPVITASRGEGVYDKANKVYTLTVSTAATVDISLSHEDYETLTLSFTSTDLLEGNIVRDVEFIHPHRAKAVITVKTSAPTSSIQIDGYEYTSKGNTFTMQFPNRNIDTNIKISAPGYQEVIVPIKPEMLVVGYHQTTVVLPKNDEVVISYRMRNNKSVELIDLYTRDYLEKTTSRDQVYYVLKKGTEVYYQDNTTNNLVYLKADKSQEIFPFGPSATQYYIVETADNFLINGHTIYYEYQNKRYIANFEAYIDDKQYYKTNIPVGSEILYLDGNDIAYKKEVSEQQNISLTKDDFNELSPLSLKLKLYDIYNNKVIDKFMISDVEYIDIDDYIIYQYPNLYLENYYIENSDLLLQEYIDGEWITNVKVIPKEDGILVRFKDAEDNIIKFGEVDYRIYDAMYQRQFIIDNNSSIQYLGREFIFNTRGYLPNLSRTEIDGKKYYVLDEPIKLNTDEYEFMIYIESNKEFLNIEIIHNNQWYFYSNPGSYGLNVKQNDLVIVRVLEYEDSKIPITYESRINLTEEYLKKGMIKLTEKAELINVLPSFKIVAGEGVEITSFYLSHNLYYIDDEGNIFYLYNPDFIFVHYKIGVEEFFEQITFDPHKEIYIID